MEFEPNKRTHRKRTLEHIQKEMKGFDHDLIMSVYHRINGRIEEADTYAEAYFTAQAEMQKETIGSPSTPPLKSEMDSDLKEDNFRGGVEGEQLVPFYGYEQKDAS